MPLRRRYVKRSTRSLKVLFLTTIVFSIPIMPCLTTRRPRAVLDASAVVKPMERASFARSSTGAAQVVSKAAGCRAPRTHDE